MRRGDLVTVAAAGDYGKPHPAVVVQTDANSYVIEISMWFDAAQNRAQFSLADIAYDKEDARILAHSLVELTMR